MNGLNNYKALRPDRSQLFSVAPIGVGTPGCESLESYVCRLARRHLVARQAVQQLVNSSGEPVYVNSADTPRLDSPTESARIFGERLAALTMVPTVTRLGLGRFSGLISPMHTLRVRRAWCGDCFCDAREAGTPAHLPMAWSLFEYQRCLIHEQVLEVQCPSCNRHCEPSNSWSREIDHCPWCNRDLARRRVGRASSFKHLERRREVAPDMFTSKVLGQFVADASSMDDLSLGDVQWAVKKGVDKGLVAHAADLANKASIARSTMSAASRQKCSLTLASVMRIAAMAEVPLAAVFSGRIRDQVDAGSIASPTSVPLPQMRRNKRRDWEQIRKIVITTVASGEAISMQGFAKKFGFEQYQIYGKMAAESAVLKTRLKEAKADVRALRIATLTQRVREARQYLERRGLRASARAISETLNFAVGTPCMRAALKQSRL